jgi:hypothetical protein
MLGWWLGRAGLRTGPVYVSAGGICRLLCACTLIAYRCEMEEPPKVGKQGGGMRDRKTGYTRSSIPNRL